MMTHLMTTSVILTGLSVSLAYCDPSTLSSQTPVTQITSQRLSSPDWKNAQLAYTLSGHSQPITQLAYSQDGQLLASSDDLEIVLWDLSTGESLHTLPGHFSDEGGMFVPLSSLAFSPNGLLLASSSSSQGIASTDSIILWNTQTGEQIHSLGGSEGCRQVQFSTDGSQLISACGLGIQVWDVNTGEQLQSFYQRPVETFALYSEENILATVDYNATGGQQEDSRSIRLWRLSENEITPLQTLEGHTSDIQQVAFTSKGDLVSRSFDSTIKVWDWQSEQVTQTFSNHSPTDTQIAFSLSPDGNHIATEFSDTLIRRIPSGENLNTTAMIRMQGGATALEFSPRNQLAWAGKPPTYPYPIIRVWQTNSGQGEEIVRSDRIGYTPISLNAEQLMGDNPTEIVLNQWGFSETHPEAQELQQQDVTGDSPYSSKQVVTLTQTGLLGDSVAGERYRVELVQRGNSWQVVWAGRQNKCYPGRGSQDWSTDLCT